MTIKLDIDHLERVGNAATEDWSVCTAKNRDCECGLVFGSAGDVYVAKFYGPRDVDDVDPVPGRKEVQLANQRFAVAARNNWPAIIEALREGDRLRAENDRLRDALTDIECDYNINEGTEGIPVAPGHKRCVDRAVAALRGE